ncbi:hypothetical protein FRC01_002041 [Tulasnella sp. 417]|nr:hypothetical protein FRC01_002041 [Tulasnella sp. 417]
MSSGVSVSSEISGMDEASSEGMGSPIMIGGPGKELDIKEGFRLDVVPDADESKKDRAMMDVPTALGRFLAPDRFSSTNHLDAALTQLARDVNIKQCGTEGVIYALVNYDFRLFEAILVSRGLGQEIRTFLSQPCMSGATPLPEPHFNVLQQLAKTISTLKGTQEVPEAVLRLGGITEAVGTALAAVSAYGRKGSSTKSSKARMQPPKKSNISDNDSLYHDLGVSPPRSIEDASKTADILRRRLSNTMKVYLEYLTTRSASNFLRNRFIQDFNHGDISRSTHHPDTLSTQKAASIAPGNVLAFLGDTVAPGRWLIVLAQRALKNLRQLSTRHHVLYNVFARRIEELSRGLFSPPNQARFLDSEYNIPLFAAELSDDICIIYQIDCGGPAQDQNQESQFIRIYDIDIIHKDFWRSVAAQLHKRDPEKLSVSGTIEPLCFDRELTETNGTRNLEAPESPFKSSEHFLELHRILALEKYIPYSKDLIDSLEKDGDGTFMFSMSPAERDVINHSSSCLVLGRSGTGKTTTMMFKMLAYELSAYQLGLPCRQMFVTQSPALAEKVKAYYNTLKQRSLDLALDHEAEQEAIPAFTLDDMDVRVRKDGAAFPTAWSKLRDDHFPLFLSYDELCNLLAQDFGQRYEPEYPSRLSYSMLSESVKTKRGKITFPVFLSRIWPHLGADRNSVDPLLLFNEIIGVIEGSEAALSSESGYLDRPTYLSLGATSQKIFAGRRDVVYDLFQRYLRYKPKGSWDSAERGHALLKAVHEEFDSRPPDPHIDFIYVDEVQDNLLLDTALLRWLCPNPHGLFFAGDTAQTVSAGSTFRFNDLKAFLYRLERRDQQVVNRKRKAVDPTFFTLSVNYRSHAGIIELAAFLVSTLSRLFSGSIDDLAREKALVVGPKPIFFLGRGQETPFTSFISSDSNAQIHFGADQVIIVRDEAACDRLRAKIGPRHASMVMTIYSSKGQEFNDVLLYDFFADSSASPNDWKALLKACTPNRVVDLETFERCHAILQAELKSLYVGLTRARERVWIWDSSNDGDAFQSIMEQEGLAEVALPEESPPPMGVRSTKRQWALRGKECFQREDYVNASLAFERANLSWWKAVADGFEQKRIAELIPIRDSSRLRSLKSAGDQISSCANRTSTAKDKTKLREISADCYLGAKAYKLAADQLYHLERYEEAAWNYRLAGSFRNAVAIIQDHRKKLSNKLVEDIKEVAAVVFSRQGETEMAKSLFETPDAHVEFLEENGFCDQRVAVLVDLARHEAAGEALVQEGRRAEAVACFLESKSPNARTKATQCLIDGLFQQVTFGVDVQRPSDELSKLVGLTSRVYGTVLENIEINAMKAIYHRDLAQLWRYGEQYAEDYPHISLLCLDTSLSFTNKQPLGKHAGKINNVIEALRTYVLYGRLIRTVAQFPDLVWGENLQRVFGLSTESPSNTKENTSTLTGIVVLPHSFVHSQAMDEVSRGRGVKTDLGILLPPETASQQVCQALLSRYNSLAGSLLDSLEAEKNNSPFTVCFQHLDHGCSNVSCKRYHLAKDDLSERGFNRRVEMHLLIVAAMECLNRNPGRRVERRFLQELWLQRLFETCYPLDIRLGNVSWVKPSLIFRYDSLISAAKIWCEDLYRAMSRKGYYFLTNAIGCAMFGSAFDYLNAVHYIPRAGWANARYKSEPQIHMQKALTWFLRNAGNRHYWGVTFINRVVVDKLKMDVSTIISFAEEVIGHLIYNAFRLSIDEPREALLPTSWVIRACQQGSSRMVLGPAPSILVEALSQILHILRSGNCGDLHYRGRPIWDIPRIYKISATAKADSGTVGQNLGTNELRLKILQHFESVRTFEAIVPPLYRSFAEARTWDGAMRALRSFAEGTASDPLLRILRKAQQEERNWSSGLRILTWTSDRNLLIDLNFWESGLAHSSSKNERLVVKSEPLSNATNDLNVPADGSAMKETGDLQPVERTQEEESAARKILECYRSYRQRSGGGLGGPLWEAYNDRATVLGCSPASRLYKIHLRVAMPQVLAHVRHIINCIEKVNREINKRVSSAPHEELDEVRGQAKVVRQLIHDAKAVAARISPDSSFHNMLSLPALKEEVKEIVALGERATKHCPSLSAPDPNYQEAVEFLIRPKPGPKPRKLPVLNVDDVFYGPNGVLA